MFESPAMILMRPSFFGRPFFFFLATMASLVTSFLHLGYLLLEHLLLPPFTFQLLLQLSNVHPELLLFFLELIDARRQPTLCNLALPLPRPTRTSYLRAGIRAGTPHPYLVACYFTFPRQAQLKPIHCCVIPRSPRYSKSNATCNNPLSHLVRAFSYANHSCSFHLTLTTKTASVYLIVYQSENGIAKLKHLSTSVVPVAAALRTSVPPVVIFEIPVAVAAPPKKRRQLSTLASQLHLLFAPRRSRPHLVRAMEEPCHQTYYWPKLLTYVQQYVRMCRDCQRCKTTSTGSPRCTISPNWDMDLLGLFPTSSLGNKWTVVAMDYLTRHAETAALPGAAAVEAAKFFLNTFRCHATPAVIRPRHSFHHRVYARHPPVDAHH